MSDCKIIQGDALEVAKTLADNSVHCIVTSPPYWKLRSYLPADSFDKTLELGQEESLDEYITNLVILFRELKRILHPTGVLWLNLGDSYAGSGGAGGDYSVGGKKEGQPKYKGVVATGVLKPKDMCGIPWRVALALQADGWWLRSDVIWNKISITPESVTDRPTKSHEYVFLLTKNSIYFYDANAIAEEATGRSNGNRTYKYDGVSGMETKQGILAVADKKWQTRNARSVWHINPAKLTEAHFATMPVELASKCIQAGSSEYGCCPTCLAPYRRIVEKTQAPHDGITNTKYQIGTAANRLALLRQSARERGAEYVNQVNTVGWQATCKCNMGEPVPSTVYDPFSGSGTTAIAAVQLGRKFLGSELNPEYITMAERRLQLQVASRASAVINKRATEIDKIYSLFDTIDDE